MRRRLLGGYLILTFVLLVAFGVPFGLIWAGQARNEALRSLSSAASTAASIVARPLSDGLVYPKDPGPGTADPSGSSGARADDASDDPHLTAASRDAISDDLQSISHGKELGSVLDPSADFLLSVGPAAPRASSVLSVSALRPSASARR